MGLEIEIDLGDMDPDQVDREGAVAPGWYRCFVENVQEDAKIPGLYTFSFAVQFPAKYAGYHIQDKLWSPDLAADTKKAEISKKRMVLYAKRLGLLSASDKGKTVAIDWTRAIGQIVCLNCKADEWTDKEGHIRQSVKVAFDGLWAATDERVPQEVRLTTVAPAAGTPAASSNGPAEAPSPPPPPQPPAGKRKFDYSDI
jgi:hypothetical protein